MNQGYTSAYTPVLRNPRLFHRNAAHSTPTYYPTRQTNTRPASSLYPPPSLHTLQSHSMVQSQAPFNHQYYPYHPVLPKQAVLTPRPFASYSIPTYSYTPTVSSKGLSLVLISTLILVALDLMIVRPQKR